MHKKIINCIWGVILVLGIATSSYGAVLFTDNFEYTDSPNNHGWGVGPTSSIAAGAGPDGSNALKITFDCDSNTCGDRWNNWNVPANNQELYIKFNFKFDCGTGNCIGGAKFLKLRGIINGTNYANSTFQVVYQTSKFEGILFGCSGTARDANSIIRYDGTTGLTSGCPTPTLSGTRPGLIDPRDGKWHTWKVHMKYNDDAQNNGLYEVWYDGTKVLGATGINNRDTADSKFFGYIILGGWNQYYGGIPYSIYYDNFVASTTDPDQVIPPSSLTGSGKP
ncbi:polysaccharide lyase [Geomonas paludis]|uniref:Polysaccharide lyase n=1 Tax=Geomonas paludis TaxID=2740185 RepID=A0A6V8MUA8_9BACT|nr:heparin lyase I family protein [Geomonas paludis]UPU37770.1 polysaccharide lyase [Geomonas paludis]GFO63690.1 hypothetical protein GMPD_16090 [Geomonas paludis]